MILYKENKKTPDDRFIEKYGLHAVPYFAQYNKITSYYGEPVSQTWDYIVFGENRHLPYENEKKDRKQLLLLWAVDDKVYATKFSPNDPTHWAALISNHGERTYDTLDSCNYGHLLFAIFYYGITEALTKCIMEYPDNVKDYLCKWMTRYCGTFSIRRQEQIAALFQKIGHKYTIRKHDEIITLYKELGGTDVLNKSCFEMVNFCIKSFSVFSKISSDSDFANFTKWIHRSEICIDQSIIEKYFCLLTSKQKCTALRKYFEDINLGHRAIDYDAIHNLVHNKYHYLSFIEQVLFYEEDTFNITSEILIDSILSYKESNGQYFQTVNGVIDGMLKYANLAHPDVDFDDIIQEWIPLCNGGVGENNSFNGFLKGTVYLEIDYEKLKIENLRKTYSFMLNRYIRKEYDIRTEEYTTEDGEIKQKEIRIEKDTFLVKKYHLDLFALFHTDTPELSDSADDEWYRFKKKTVDITPLLDKLQKLIQDKNLLEKTLFSPDTYISFFTKPKTLSVQIKEEAESGIESIISTDTIRTNIHNTLVHFFNYNEDKKIYEGLCTEEALNAVNRLHHAQWGPNIYNPEKNTKFLWEGKYRPRFLRGCTPSISREVNFITNSKVLYCAGNFCFRSAFRIESYWESYRLLDIMRILGYNLTYEEEGHILPKQSFIDFVTVLFRTKSLWEHMTCDCCEHILFPTETITNRTVNIYNHFNCRNPKCKRSSEVIKLTFCTECKSGVIDSRSTAKCPNDLIICPICLHCCDLNMFKKRLQQCRDNGWTPNPELIFKVNHGEAHQELNQKFCPKCGQKLSERITDGREEYYCKNCNFTRNKIKYRHFY